MAGGYPKIEMGTDYIYHTNSYGDFYVVERVNKKIKNNHISVYYKIKFIETGYEKIVKGSEIRSMSIRDPYHISIYGVACKGVTPPISQLGNEYAIWHCGISRCYNEKDSSYPRYGALGVRFSDEWLTFENFLRDLPYLEGYDLWKVNPNKYDLDKDKLQMHLPINQRVYSKYTCCFISKSENRIYTSQGHGEYSQYNGVSYDKRRNKYSAGIKVDRKTINLGRFTNEEAAATVYDYYARHLGDRVLNNTDMDYDTALSYRDKKKNKYIYKVLHYDVKNSWEE